MEILTSDSPLETLAKIWDEYSTAASNSLRLPLELTPAGCTFDQPTGPPRSICTVAECKCWCDVTSKSSCTNSAEVTSPASTSAPHRRLGISRISWAQSLPTHRAVGIL